MQLLNLPPLLLQKAAAVILDTNYKTILVEIFTQNSLYIEETGSAPVYVKYGLTQRPKGRVISKWTQSAVSWWNWPEIEHTYNPFAFVSVIFCFIHCVWMRRAMVTTAIGGIHFESLNVWCLSGSFALVTQGERVMVICLFFHFVQFWSLVLVFCCFWCLCEKVSVIGKDWFFFITLFCIVSLKLINIPIEIVIFVLGSYRLGYKAYIDIPNSLPAVGPGLNFGCPGLWDTIVSVSLFPAPLWFVFTFAL